MLPRANGKNEKILLFHIPSVLPFIHIILPSSTGFPGGGVTVVLGNGVMASEPAYEHKEKKLSSMESRNEKNKIKSKNSSRNKKATVNISSEIHLEEIATSNRNEENKRKKWEKLKKLKSKIKRETKSPLDISRTLEHSRVLNESKHSDDSNGFEKSKSCVPHAKNGLRKRSEFDKAYENQLSGRTKRFNLGKISVKIKFIGKKGKTKGKAKGIKSKLSTHRNLGLHCKDNDSKSCKFYKSQIAISQSFVGWQNSKTTLNQGSRLQIKLKSAGNRGNSIPVIFKVSLTYKTGKNKSSILSIFSAKLNESYKALRVRDSESTSGGRATHSTAGLSKARDSFSDKNEKITNSRNLPTDQKAKPTRRGYNTKVSSDRPKVRLPRWNESIYSNVHKVVVHSDNSKEGNSMVKKNGNGKKNPRSPDVNQGNPINKIMSMENLGPAGPASDNVNLYTEEELLEDGDVAMNELGNTIGRANLNSPRPEINAAASLELRQENVDPQTEAVRLTTEAPTGATSSGQGSDIEDENLFGSTQWYIKQQKLEAELRHMRRQLEEKDEALKQASCNGAIPKAGRSSNVNDSNWNADACALRDKARYVEQRAKEARERQEATNPRTGTMSDLRNAMNNPDWDFEVEPMEQVPFRPVKTHIRQETSNLLLSHPQRKAPVPSRSSGSTATPYDVNVRGRSHPQGINRPRNLIEGSQTIVLLTRGYPAEPLTESRYKAVEQQLNKLSIHMDRSNRGHNVAVTSISYRQGAIFVTVNNNATMEWIRRVAERTLELESFYLDEAPLRTAYQMWYPCSETTFDECLNLINRQNIPTEDWHLLKSYTNKPKSGQKFLLLGSEDLDERTSINGTLQFQFRWMDRKGTIRRLAPVREARAQSSNGKNLLRSKKNSKIILFKELKNKPSTCVSRRNWTRSIEKLRKCSRTLTKENEVSEESTVSEVSTTWNRRGPSTPTTEVKIKSSRVIEIRKMSYLVSGNVMNCQIFIRNSKGAKKSNLKYEIKYELTMKSFKNRGEENFKRKNLILYRMKLRKNSGTANGKRRNVGLLRIHFSAISLGWVKEFKAS